MKKLLTIYLLIATAFTSITYSQEKFNNKEIEFLQKIANNSSFNTIKKYMKKKGYNLLEPSRFVKKNENEFDFSNEKISITIEYTPSKKLSMMTLFLKSFSDSLLYDRALKENDFINFKKEGENRLYPILFWKKGNYSYQFITTIDISGDQIMLITEESEYYIK